MKVKPKIRKDMIMSLEASEVSALVAELANLIVKVVRWKKLSGLEREAIASRFIELGTKLAEDIAD